MLGRSMIESHVLQIFRNMDTITLPVEPKKLLRQIPNCRTMGYSTFARLNGCSYSDVVTLCESQDGCTHYDVGNDRDLVLLGDQKQFRNVPGRRRWTGAHELGHVVLQHFPKFVGEKQSFSNLLDAQLELEADRFAATLLCPKPWFEPLRVRSPLDVHYVFGVSMTAANYRWADYERSVSLFRGEQYETAWGWEMRELLEERMQTGAVQAPSLREANSQRRGNVISIWKDDDEP